MNSFYGGPAGQSFDIAEVFSTYGDLLTDVTNGWKSTIAVGEFVMVSYGRPGDADYETNRDKDLKAVNKNYNSTLWQKVYDENNDDDTYALASSTTGINYKFISSCTGYTPYLNAEVVDWTEPGTQASVSVDTEAEGYPDKVKFDFTFPGSWDFITDKQKVNPLAADGDPAIDLINIGTLGDEEDQDPKLNQGKAYMGKFVFSLPKSQVITEATRTLIAAEEAPTVELDQGDPDDPDGTPSVTNPVLRFELPVAQFLKTENVTTTEEALDAASTPTVVVSYEEEDTLKRYPILTFGLPKAWNLAINEVITELGPLSEPIIEPVEDGSFTTKTWKLSLPRNVEFHVVNTMEEMTTPGDYYILKSTGSLYGYDNGWEEDNGWKELVCFVPPISNDVDLTVIKPYEENGEPSEPTADIEYTNDSWKFKFELAKAPKVDKNFEFVGSTEDGEVDIDISNSDTDSTLVFSFKIPAGSKLFAGVEIAADGVTIEIEGARNGDLYLNSSTGKVYILEAGVWKEQEDTLKGPIGDALNIVANYTIKEADGYVNTIAAISGYITTHYSAEISNQDIFAISYVEEDSGAETAYWYFKVDNEWGCVQLTGGVASLIETEYNNESEGAVINKTYSISYINSLIEGTKDETGEKKTYSQAKINELLSALDETLNTWGSFKDLPDMTIT